MNWRDSEVCKARSVIGVSCESRSDGSYLAVALICFEVLKNPLFFTKQRQGYTHTLRLICPENLSVFDSDQDHSKRFKVFQSLHFLLGRFWLWLKTVQTELGGSPSETEHSTHEKGSHALEPCASAVAMQWDSAAIAFMALGAVFQ